MRIVEAVVREHAEQAAFLWVQHRDALAEDPPDAQFALEVDGRLALHLRGLALAGAAGLPFAVEQFDTYPEPGEQFAAGWLALQLGDRDQAEAIGGKWEATPDRGGGFVGAMLRHPPARTAALVRDWIGGPDAFFRYVAAATLRGHGADANDWLPQLLADADGRVRAEACRLAADRGRRDALPHIAPLLDDGEVETAEAAALALTVLGQGRAAVPVLTRSVEQGAKGALPALRALVNVLGPQEARSFMGALREVPGRRPLAVRGAGMLGDPSVLPWLVRQMSDPAVCVAAAAAFQELTGPVDDQDDHFYADGSFAAEVLGPDFEDIEDPVPKAEAFGALLTSAPA